METLPKQPKAQSVTAEEVRIGGMTLNRLAGAVDPAELPPLLGVVDELQTIAFAVQANMPVLLVGDTGTGKTSIVRWLAKVTGNVYRRLNLNGGTTADELAGRYIVAQESGVASMQWIDGVLVDAMKHGHWLLLDEINSALPEVLFYLHALLDDDRQIVLAEKNGEVITPHVDFRLFATMNPSLEYAGTRDLNKAFLSRFSVVINAEFPTQVQEASIVSAHVPEVDGGQVGVMTKVASDLRKAHQAGELNYICSTRDLLHWARLVPAFGLEKGATFAVVNRAQNEEDIKAIKDVLRLHIGTLEKDGATAFDFSALQKQAGRVARMQEVLTSTFQAVGIKTDPTSEAFITAVLDAEQFDGAEWQKTIKTKTKKPKTKKATV